MENCIFCKIKNKEIPEIFLYESEDVMAFPDINPLAQVHILVVPKEHIPTFMDIKETHKNIMSEMVGVVQKLIKEKNIEGKYRVNFNGGSLQHVAHLHWHLLGGDIKPDYDR